MIVKTRRTSCGRGGFTLMEVLLVLAILVILGSLVGVYFANTQETAYAKAAQTQIKMFEDQLDLYSLDLIGFPSTAQGLNALRARPGDLPNPQKWKGPYAKKDIPLDPWDNPYQYELIDLKNYRIWSWGPDRKNGTEDDITN